MKKRLEIEEVNEMIQQGMISKEDIKKQYTFIEDFQEIAKRKTNTSFIIEQASNPTRINKLFRKNGFIMLQSGQAERVLEQKDIEKYELKNNDFVVLALHVNSSYLVIFKLEYFFLKDIVKEIAEQ
ncbi:MAG: hypothetical protein ACTSPI_11900 [Candidatus Heimdallarchaeaceae archaeon]